MKKYIIREIDYGCDSSHLFQLGKGFFNLVAQFDNRTEAETAYWQLEQKAFQGKLLGGYELMTSYSATNQALLIEICEYIYQEFDIDFLMQYNNSEHFYANRNIPLPLNLSLEQVKKLVDLSKIQNYQLLELEENTTNFYGIYFTGNYGHKEGWKMNSVISRNEKCYSTVTVPAVYQSEWDAIEDIKDKYFYYLDNFLHKNSIKGSLIELSETPKLLNAFIATTNGIEYDKSNGEISFNSNYFKNIVAFNQLLKAPIFVIRPLPEDLVETCTYECVEM